MRYLGNIVFIFFICSVCLFPADQKTGTASKTTSTASKATTTASKTTTAAKASTAKAGDESADEAEPAVAAPAAAKATSTASKATTTASKATSTASKATTTASKATSTASKATTTASKTTTTAKASTAKAGDESADEVAASAPADTTKTTGTAGKATGTQPPAVSTSAAVASTIPASSSPVTVSSQGNSIEDQRRATIQYGTETEIITLIQTLKNEKAEYLDAELTALIPTTKNRAILIGTWSFFGDRAKPGLEPRALQAIDAWDTENAEIVTAAIDYVGKIKSAQALKPLEKLIDTEDRRFMNASFRALGQAASAGDADGTASFLIDYYTNRNPGDENMKEIIVAVGETGSLTGVDFLAGIAENENGRGVLRSAAVEALAKLGTGSDAIIVAANASDPNVRAAAIASLGPFSGAAVDNIILESFRDSYYRTRIAAAKAAGDRKLAAAVPYLQYRAKQDDVPAVKDEAIKALGIIGNDESMTTLESLFFERRSPDRVRLLVAEMLIKNNADAYIEKLIIELDEAKRANLTGLYNGFLKVLGMAKTPKLEGLSRRFLSAGGIVEKSLALDMIGNNEFQSLSDEVRILTADKNVGLARKAQTTLDKLVKS